MKTTQEQVSRILRTLPIGYYGTKAVVSLDMEADTSRVNPMTREIRVAFSNVRDYIAGLPETAGAEEVETAIRCSLYHELSHLLLSPIEVMQLVYYVQYHCGVSLAEAKDVCNIIEDERIETLLRAYYHGVNFRENIKRISGYVPGRKAESAKELLFRVCRYREGPADLIAEMDKIAETLNGAIADGFDMSRAGDMYSAFYNKVQARFEEERKAEAPEAPEEREGNASESEEREEGESGSESESDDPEERESEMPEESEGEEETEEREKSEEPEEDSGNGESDEDGEDSEGSEGSEGTEPEEDTEDGEDSEESENGESGAPEGEEDSENAEESGRESEETKGSEKTTISAANLEAAKNRLASMLSEKTNPAIDNSVRKLVIQATKRRALDSGIRRGYTGRMDVKAVAKRDDYRWWTRQGKDESGKGSKLHLRLLVDCSGSFCASMPKLNELVSSLLKMEREMSDIFSFDVLETTMETKIHDKTQELSACGGNDFFEGVPESFAATERKGWRTVTVAVWDGYMSSERYLRQGSKIHTVKEIERRAAGIVKQDAEAFRHINNRDTIIVSDETNRALLDLGAKNARRIYLPRGGAYAQRFIGEVLKELGRVL